MPIYNPTGGGSGSSFSVTEIDGAPSVANPTAIKFTNGSVTDNGDGTVSVATGAGGGGDVSSNTAVSVDSEIALFSGVLGKTIKRATGTGIATLTSGVLSASATTGTGSVVLAADPALTGNPTAPTQTFGDNTTKLATTAFVQAAELGQNFKEACRVATTAALVGVYNNGASGVGATFTYTATGTDNIDGVNLVLGDRVLVKNQASDLQNGIYTVTTAGAIGIAGILTRATDANQSGEYLTGDSVFITAGTTQTATTWAYTGIDSPTMGTTSLTYVQVAGQGSFTGGNGITITGTSIAIDTSVTVDKTTVQTLTNKILSDSTTTVGNVSDTTKALAFSLGGATTGTKMTIASSHTVAQTITLPNATGTLPIILGAGGTVSSTSSSTTEVSLIQVKVPANSMGLNGGIKVEVLYKFVGTVAAKTMNIRLSTTSGDTSAGALFYNLATATTSLSHITPIRPIWNSNSASAQIFFPAASGGTGNSTITPGTGAINTANDAWININGFVGNAGDSIQVVGYTVTLFPGV